MHRISPSFPVSNIESAIDFYTRKLGFEVEFHNPTVYARVKRGDVVIGLGHAREDQPVGSGGAYIETDRIETVYEEFLAKGVEVLDPLRQQTEYDLKDFVITDLDGNRIGIGGK